MYVSGQGPIDPETGEVTGSDIREQTAQTLENIATILEAGGSLLDQAVKVTVFVTNMDSYDIINDVYGEYMNDPYPARSAFEVVELPVDIGIEIEIITATERHI